MRRSWTNLKSVGRLAVLMLVGCLSFWLSPPPQGQPDVEYWGHYARVGPELGFIVNHDSYGYLAVAQHPSKLLLPKEVRQSRPLYALLGAAVGYPLLGVLRLAGRLDLPQFWPDDELFYSFYSGYVLLNGLILLGSLLLLRHLFEHFTAGRGEQWQFFALAWVLVANPIIKMFFWTAHQQMLAFFVPLFCLALALWLVRRSALSWVELVGLALGLGLLPLLYGSFVLAWPALAYGLIGRAASKASATSLPPAAAPGWLGMLGQVGLSLGLFAVPTLLWIALLRSQGTTYYNYEAVRWHQVVWIFEARHLPLQAFASLVGAKLAEYVHSWQLMRWWLLVGGALYVASRWRYASRAGALLPAGTGRALAWVTGCCVLFFGLLGYYPERLTYTLLPLVLCLLAALLPRWPSRYARPVALAVAAGWHLYVLLSYGPFS
jgi:hypothetical protein